VVVGPREALARSAFSIKELNWLDAMGPRDSIRVKVRSAQPPVKASITPSADAQASITLNDPYEGIAPGQACVVYDGDRVLGGGWIN
jgi:tRNA-specific 2-thiouridylase